jgi:hypothetical protein
MPTNNALNITNGSVGSVLTGNGPLVTPTFQAIPSSAFGPVVKTGTVVASSLSAVTIPYITSQEGTLANTTNLSTTSMYIQPIYIDEAKTFTRFGIKVTSVPGVGSAISIALYDSSQAGNLPGVVLANAIDIDTSASGINEGVVSCAISNVGWYWIAIQRNAVAAVTVCGVANLDGYSILTNKAYINLGNLSGGNMQCATLFGVTNVYGSFPSNPAFTQNQPVYSVPLPYIR